MLLEALDRVLPSEDSDISRLVERGFKQQGIDVHTGAPVADVQVSESGVSFTYGSAGADGAEGPPRVEVDYLVIAAGRGADVEGLGLAEAGVELDERGLVKVDGALRTSRAGVYAIGDLVVRAGARAQGLRGGHHRRRGLRRPADPPARRTSTSPAPRSARRTSARSA